MKPSEILAGALELWGPNGERWCRNDLVNRRGQYCLYGGIGKVATGYACYETENKEHLQTIKLLLKSLPLDKQSWALDGFNDSAKDFSIVKSVVCQALKTALAEEDEQAFIENEEQRQAE